MKDALLNTEIFCVTFIMKLGIHPHLHILGVEK